jgi:hypothetical protein
LIGKAGAQGRFLTDLELPTQQQRQYATHN